MLHERAPRSLADGCTFNVAATAALITNPLLFKTLPCDPAEDNVPVAVVARVVRVLGPSPPARGSLCSASGRRPEHAAIGPVSNC